MCVFHFQEFPSTPSKQFNLSPLTDQFSGKSKKVKDMNIKELQAFIPKIIKKSLKCQRPKYGDQNSKPPWWPDDLLLKILGTTQGKTIKKGKFR